MIALTIAIASYFLLAVVSITDKFLVSGKIFKPKVFTFYSGVLGGLAILLIPFFKFSLPGVRGLLVDFSTGALFILSLFFFYKALRSFEVSRVIPIVGALLPIFTLILVFLFHPDLRDFGIKEIIAFILLISGSILIVYERGKKTTRRAFLLSAFASFLFALMFFLSKEIYISQGFLSGFILIRVGAALTALLFLLSKEVRMHIKDQGLKPTKLNFLFISNQGIAAVAGILQNVAVSFSSIVLLPIVNALQGVQYAFVFIFSLFFSRVLKEEVSKRIIFQKIMAIILIGLGIISLFY